MKQLSIKKPYSFRGKLYVCLLWHCSGLKEISLARGSVEQHQNIKLARKREEKKRDEKAMK